MEEFPNIIENSSSVLEFSTVLDSAELGTTEIENITSSYDINVFSDLEFYSYDESSVISGSSVQYGPIEYGVVNYVLIAFSVLIGSALLGAVVYLIYREYVKNREEKETKFREKLLMRRPGISGRSGGIVNADFRNDSESDRNTSYIFLSPTPTSEISL